ncbi:MAG: hypothetical protein AAF548_08780 [Actinomycetota bacterium]
MEDERRVGWLGKAWIAGVIAYAVARAAIVWPTLGDYGVNPWAFLAIDVGTAWPYAYGQVRVVTEAKAKNWSSTQIWALIALLSFVAPYAYIAGAGSGEMPLIAWIVIGLLMVFFGAASIIRILRQVRAPEPAAG